MFSKKVVISIENFVFSSTLNLEGSQHLLDFWKYPIIYSFRPLDSTLVSVLYFFGSFLFLIGRTVAVTLFAARINDQSRVVLPLLYNCPASKYTIEVNLKVILCANYYHIFL